jgi:hypothetical protein
MHTDGLEARLDQLEYVVEHQRREIEHLRSQLRVSERTATTTRRVMLKRAGMAAAGVTGSAAILGLTATRANAETTVFDGNIVVRGSTSDATASEIGDGTHALVVRGGEDGVKLSSRSGTRLLLDAQTRWDSDDDHARGSNLDINKPAAVFRQTGEDHKGAMVEFQQYFQAGSHPNGIATNTPGASFDVAQTGYKRVAWILAHYDSPNPADGVHQHLNFETCKADLQTIVTRFQISWGEDVALCSFPNSNVRVIQSNRTLSFGGGNQVRAVYSPDAGKLEYSGDPVAFGMGQLQVAGTWVSPTYFARKPSAEYASGSSALRDDAHLRVPVAANATYTFAALVVYRAHVDADLRAAWAVPSGATLRWTPGGTGIVATSVVGPLKASAHGTEPVNVGGAGTATPMALAATGIVRTAGAGELRLRWAQDTPHPSTLTIERDSYLQLTRVG